MKKRLFAFLLALCLVLNMTSGIVFATEELEEPDGHNWDYEKVEIISEPTCTAEGEWVLYCQDEDCGIKLDGGALEMQDHTPEAQPCQNDHTEPTCTEDGHNWTHCSACKQLIKEVDGKWIVCDHSDCDCFIPATGHNYVDFEAVEPTCEEEGHNAYRACVNEIDGVVCGANEPGHEKVTIPANGHGTPVGSDGYVPQCQHDMSDEESYDYSVPAVCSICGAELKYSITVSAPHDWVDMEGREPTCEVDGYTEYRLCSVCGRIEGKETIPAHGHSYTVYYGTLAGSCTEDGRIAGWKCEHCGADDPERPVITIPAPGHKEEIIPGWEPTCTENGASDGWYCTVCGEETYPQKAIPALGHTWEMVPGTKANCVDDGLGAHNLCTVCGEKEFVDEAITIIPAHGHSNVEGFWPENAEIIDLEMAGTVRNYENGGVWTWCTEEELERGCEVTCTEDGYEPEERCAFCGEVVVEAVVTPALGHDWELTVPGTMPTCTEQGVSDLWECSRCDEYRGGETINARGHVMVTVEAQLPDCYNDGNFEYTYCEVCGYCSIPTNQKIYDERLEIEPGVYQLVAQTGPFSIPFYLRVDAEGNYIAPAQATIPAYDHQYRDDVKALAPTCTENGIEEGATRCRICGEFFDLYVIPATGHGIAEVEGYEPTCLENGLQSYIFCVDCGKASNGTYEDDGERHALLTASEIFMPEDGSDPAEFVIDALGHDEQPGVALEPTCHEEGHTEGIYCARCGVTIEESEPIDPMGCDFVLVSDKVDATCTEEGYEAYYECSRCECCTEGGEVIPATNHDAGEVTEAIAATCTEYGFGPGVHCTKCEIDYAPVYDFLTGKTTISFEDLTEGGWLIIPELWAPYGHRMGEVWNAEPTCTEIGYDNYSECLFCDYSEGEILSELGHLWVDVPGGEETAATCLKAGTDGIHQCVRPECRLTEAIVVPALGHDWVKVDAVEATCAAPGNIEYEQCSRCGLYRVEGVEYDEYNVVVEDDGKHDDPWHVDGLMPTCKDDGHSDGQWCSVCDYNDFTVFPADADAYHAFLETEEELAKIEWTIKEAEGMQYKLCPCCGYILDIKLYPEVLKGDVNMDGKVTSRDARMILQFLAGTVKELPNEKAAYFNDDMDITSRDARDILNWLAGN